MDLPSAANSSVIILFLHELKARFPLVLGGEEVSVDFYELHIVHRNNTAVIIIPQTHFTQHNLLEIYPA